MRPNRELQAELRDFLPEPVRATLDLAAERIVQAKARGRPVVAVTGSGPNLHEGVTTLLAELIHRGIVDGAITSSAVVAHEMAGTLDRVKRIRVEAGTDIGLPRERLPRGEVFEVTILSPQERTAVQAEIGEGWDLYDRLLQAPGEVIVKAAGNMAWPMGLRTELLAREAETLARQYDTTVEHVAGVGADRMTMIGAAAERGVPLIVSVPQLVGGGAVGLAIGDALSISRRSRLVADLLESAAVIVESAVALCQEIHDGPFETYTGHGIWAAWMGLRTFRLKGKTLVRIDLDPNLELAWRREREASQIQQAVDRGLPKTKLAGIAFRMEMSGFARLEDSIPVTADVGVAWPLLAATVADALGIELNFLSAPQETQQGKRVREWIVESVRALDKRKMYEGIARRAVAGGRSGGVAHPGASAVP